MELTDSKVKNQLIKILLLLAWIIVVVHLIKDITQDLLGISSVLDNLGNIEEDTSSFPLWLEYLYHWAMINTVIGEAILIYLIPKYIFKSVTKLERILIIVFLIYIPFMFFIAYLLSL